jgi:O-antigen ligase
MPEYIRALIVVLFCATTIFAISRPTICSLMDANDFTRRRNLWLVLTLAAFLSTSFWIYAAVAIPLLIYMNSQETNPPALFFILMFILPTYTIQIPGMGLINFLFDISNFRLLALLILLPAFFQLIRRSDVRPFGRAGPDLALAAYLLVDATLNLREGTLSDALRHAFYLFTDAFLPYFVISRSLKDLQAFRDALVSLVLAIMILAPLALFETVKHWHLYAALTHVLHLEGGGIMGYLERDNILRAFVTAGQPIALGYLMVVGIGFYLFLQHFIENKLIRRSGMALLVAGLISPLSRGPWLGAVALLVVFIATGNYAKRRLISLAFVALLAFPVVSALPGGQKIINLLPFIGTTEHVNIDYRRDLLANSMIVIERNPWFGSVDYLKAPEMQIMRQGEGIIDVVNTYIGIALETGFVGLGLFIAFFALTLLGIYRALRSLADRDSAEYLLGRTLLVTLLSILLMIFTVSSITVIPLVYWSVAGLSVAYAQMVRKMQFATLQNDHR